MKILVLNCGSSSIKYALYDMTNQSVITSGGIEKIGLPDSFIKMKDTAFFFIFDNTMRDQWFFYQLSSCHTRIQ